MVFFTLIDMCVYNFLFLYLWGPHECRLGATSCSRAACWTALC